MVWKISTMINSLLQMTCLKTSYSLRKQLLLSFGSAAVITLTLVVSVGVIIAHQAGEIVRCNTEDLLREQIRARLIRSSRYEAETIGIYMDSLTAGVGLAAELVKDRITGYPEPGWEEDMYVPFFDRETQTNKYPLNSQLLPLDWAIEQNINEQNIDEHLQERADWLKVVPSASTASASFFIQGSCDPNETDPDAITYYEGCDIDNNNITTGGAVQPTLTAKALHEKSSDLGVLFKPLFEAEPEVLVTGVYFHNSGAGAVMQYPGNVRNSTVSPYTSKGCEWMNEINPRTGNPFGTEDEISRCHPVGEMVHQREYNPLEREWFQETTLSNDDVTWHGPFLGNDDKNLPLVTVGKAVFDRRTGNFIGNVAFDVAVHDFHILLQRNLRPGMNVSVVRLKDDTVFADTIDLKHQNSYPVKVFDTEIISLEVYKQIKEIFENKRNSTIVEYDGVVYTATGLAFALNESDSSFKSKFLVIHAYSKSVWNVVEEMNDDIYSDVHRTIYVSLGVGAAGLILVFFLVWFFSGRITEPLLWIEGVAWSIVNHGDERANERLQTIFDLEERPTKCWRPKTELSQLVSEFRTMTSGCSGEGASRPAFPHPFEISNRMTWQSDYQQLYSYSSDTSEKKTIVKTQTLTSDEMASTSRDSNHAPAADSTPCESNLPTSALVPKEEISRSFIVPAPLKKNQGRAIMNLDETRHGDASGETGSRIVPMYRSSLFWYTLALIGLPMVFSNSAICTIVSFQILEAIPSWRDASEDESMNLEVELLETITGLKDIQAEAAIQDVVRDLHFLNRLDGWLLFGGINRSKTFTYLEEATQECSSYTDPETSCPFFEDPERFSCACEWDDLNNMNCTNYNETSARSLQVLFALSQARDADNITGDRKSSSFGIPGIDDSAATTSWWNDFDSIPGSHKGADASGFRTTYDRLRVSSASGVAKFPVYNYMTELNRPKYTLGSYTAFENDGSFLGFSGCGHINALSAHFVNTEENKASLIDPVLCPDGKYGYDPRCRDWYDTGRRKYLLGAIPVYLTAPYVFAVEGEPAASATSPIANPSTKEYAGQTLLDYYPYSLRRLFDSLTDEISFMITTLNMSDSTLSFNSTEGDIVIGPDRSKGWEPSWIADELFPNEAASSPFRKNFEVSILPRMKMGLSGKENFMRTNRNGEVEALTLAFRPVFSRVLLPLNPSDFSRGVKQSTILVYSVGIISYNDAIVAPWEAIVDSIDNKLTRLSIIYVVVVAVLSLILIFAAYKITVNVTKPMLTLLLIVQRINAGLVEDDIPPLHGGAREVHQVYNSFAKLYKIISVSNVAFFSGNLEWAYNFMIDALKLFRRINDEKAIGVVCNNLGNTMYAFCLEGKDHGDCCKMLPGICIIKSGISFYNEAVEAAEEQFGRPARDEDKASFASQLSDRLFNRALFLLLVAGRRCAPDDAMQRGLKDVERVCDLDRDVTDFYLDRKLLWDKSTEYYCRLLRRAMGLVNFYDNKELRQLWDAKILVNKADQFLFAAWDHPSSPLFRQFSATGRLQQLEIAAIELDLTRGRLIDASRLAIRMFAEDEYLLEDAFSKASNALLTLLRSNPAESIFSGKTKVSLKSDFRKMLRSCRHSNVDIGKCVVFAFEINEQWEGHPLLKRVNERCLKLYDESILSDDYVGLNCYTTQGDLNTDIHVKFQHNALQRARLDLATTATSESFCPSFPFAIQMCLDTGACIENDSYVLLLTDGYSWDSSIKSTVKSQIEKVNLERDTTIHVIIFGMDIDEEGVVDECKSMCTVSKNSFYVDLDLSNVDATFNTLERVMCNESGMKRFYNCHGITMEKF